MNFDPDAKINAPFPFFIDDYMHDAGHESAAFKWYYFAFLAYLWKHGKVANNDRAIAEAMNMPIRGKYRQNTAKTRFYACYHPRIEGFLTQKRVDRDRLKHLHHKHLSKLRVEKHRGVKRVTNSDVTRSSIQNPYIYKGTVDNEPSLFPEAPILVANGTSSIASATGRQLRAPGAKDSRLIAIRNNLIDVVGIGTVEAAENGVEWAIKKCEQASRNNRLGWYPDENIKPGEK